MKSESFSTSQDEVLARLGDKLLEALDRAVRLTEASLADYRSRMPAEAASHHPRGLANIIHDWLWANLRRELDGNEGVVFVEKGPTRVMIVHEGIRVRVKRLTASGGVATYPTKTALSFYEQRGEQLTLFGSPEVHLVFGYVWDPHLQEIGAVVVSCPISIKEPLWVYEVPGYAEGAVLPRRSTPPLPGLFAAEGEARGLETSG